ncbi:hypothetical protein [Pseudokineococcus sp. 1T1Z-3]|uniref:hypothetical protein n=1 Tax=Pseudokineococcus sp. 1T1Z-3 TaxID=3132745 RepID=UPI0030B68CC9
MPRSNRPRRGGRPLPRAPRGGGGPSGDGARPLGAGLRRVEDHGDGEWVVQVVTGHGPAAAEGRSYRCPGCDQLVPAGSPHVVAWPADGLLGSEAALADRRHWHRPCWERRAVRRPR